MREPSQHRVGLLRWLPAALWALGIFIASSRDWGPSAFDPSRYGVFGPVIAAFFAALPAALPRDKAVHAVIFGVQAALLRAASDRPRFAAVRWSWLATAIWGAIDEVHQGFVPGRSQDVWDWLADCTGALVALVVWEVVSRLRGRQ
ncbi:MAG: VanZ family protein [Deltaproteobacteria bacterium]|nr:VanZ family protein [Deltaproteobacteria bacterium]